MLNIDKIIDDTIELTVKIKGRDCDSNCNPINHEFPFDNNG